MLKQAVLTLALEQTVTEGGSVSLLIVSFGAERQLMASNTVELTMRPRVREANYSKGVKGLRISGSPPPAKQISEKARSMGSNLGHTILGAIQASVREYDTDPGKPKRPPMAMAALEVTFSLVLDQKGNLGLKKEWASPISLELGGGKATMRANTLVVSYARPE